MKSLTKAELIEELNRQSMELVNAKAALRNIYNALNPEYVLAEGFEGEFLSGTWKPELDRCSISHGSMSPNGRFGEGRGEDEYVADALLQVEKVLGFDGISKKRTMYVDHVPWNVLKGTAHPYAAAYADRHGKMYNFDTHKWEETVKFTNNKLGA